MKDTHAEHFLNPFQAGELLSVAASRVLAMLTMASAMTCTRATPRRCSRCASIHPWHCTGRKVTLDLDHRAELLDV